jgi:hypothetical protein
MTHHIANSTATASVDMLQSGHGRAGEVGGTAEDAVDLIDVKFFIVV